mgnify:FL=1|tara:strand:+ start:639 stop:782 length:144 start_codon:yes stop_codon:yes gene_type:complete
MTIDDFIKENIPDDVIWRDKMIELVTKAYELGQVEERKNEQLGEYNE